MSGRRGLLFRSRSASAAPQPTRGAVAEGVDQSNSSMSTTNATGGDYRIQEVVQQNGNNRRMMRRSSLDLKQNHSNNNNNNGNRTRSFFQRRGSFTGGPVGTNASVGNKDPLPQPPVLQPQPQPQEPAPRRRMFRRDSMSRRDSMGQQRASPVQSPSDSTAPTTSTESLPVAMNRPDTNNSNPRRPFRRGSFGPRGDAKPPRPVSRRASIGDDSNNLNNNGLVATDSSASLQPLAAAATPSTLPSDHDFHHDSLSVFPPAATTIPEIPRRSARRSSIGPGIEHNRGGSNESISGTSNQMHKKKKGLFRKEGFIVNPFRRSHHGKGEADSNNNKGITPAAPASAELPAPAAAAPHPSRRGDWEPTNVPVPGLQPPSAANPSRRGDWEPTQVPYPPPRSMDQGFRSSSRSLKSVSSSRDQVDLLQEDDRSDSPPSATGRRVRFAAEPEIHIVTYAGKATVPTIPNSPDEDDATTATDSSAAKAAETDLKARLWWNSEEMAQIRQECMELVKDYLDDTEYMDAVTKLFSSYKKSVSEEEVQTCLEKVAQNADIRGLEMHVVPRGGLLCEKHRRIVLTNVASTTVDGLSNTGEGWLLIRKESMKASRACRQYALKMAEHDAIEAIESVISPWDEMADSADGGTPKKKDVAPRTPTASRLKFPSSSDDETDIVASVPSPPPLYEDDNENNDNAPPLDVNQEKPALPLYQDDEDTDPAPSPDCEQGAGEASSQDTYA